MRPEVRPERIHHLVKLVPPDFGIARLRVGRAEGGCQGALRAFRGEAGVVEGGHHDEHDGLVGKLTGLDPQEALRVPVAVI